MGPSFAFFHGSADVLFVFALILLLFSGKKLPELGRGLKMGIDELLRAGRGLANDMVALFQSRHFVSREELLSWTTLALIAAVGALVLIAFQLSR